MRYFFDISYHGGRYHGWQIQQNAESVQDVLQKAFATIFRSEIELTGSGRTDTGVHAEQQIVHADMPVEVTEDHLYKLNRILPHDISINSFRKVKDEAHARFDATSRKYQYRISRVKNPFLNGLSYQFFRPLDIDKMNAAAKILFEYEDFESFSRTNTSVNTFLCKIMKAEWKQEGDVLIFEVEANRFLRGMVRALVGTMLHVGQGQMSPEEMHGIIKAKDRRKAGEAAPPEGLFLVEVNYPY